MSSASRESGVGNAGKMIPGRAAQALADTDGSPLRGSVPSKAKVIVATPEQCIRPKLTYTVGARSTELILI